MKYYKLVVILMIFLLVLSLGVYAYGGGSRKTVSKPVSCEERSTVKDRVQCRLEKNEILAPEACRTLEKSDDCKTLYRRVQTCYDKTGGAKDECFKSKARFSHVTVKNEVVDNPGNVRNYLLFLLYDLQGLVDDAYTGDKISVGDAADLITEIVEVKQLVLLGKPKSEIRTAVNSLKNNWKVKL